MEQRPATATTSDFATLATACRENRPAVFLVLGSGLGVVADQAQPIARCAFADVPGMPASTTLGHRGVLTLATWAGQTVLVAEGRLHGYEGHTWDTVTLPIRLAARLGVRVALLTNAAGGIRDDLVPGTLMPIHDQLDWTLPNPWRTPRTPSPYDMGLLATIANAGEALGWGWRFDEASSRIVKVNAGARVPVSGVYAGVHGPNYETPAEIRALWSVGADAVGMSTTREIGAGREAGLRCAAISLITNRAAGLGSGTLSHDEVIAAGLAAADALAALLNAILVRLPPDQQ